MPITLICPHLSCGKPVVVPDSVRGQVVRCSHCRKTFLVPDRRAPAPGGSDAESETNRAAKK